VPKLKFYLSKNYVTAVTHSKRLKHWRKNWQWLKKYHQKWLVG